MAVGFYSPCSVMYFLCAQTWVCGWLECWIHCVLCTDNVKLGPFVHHKILRLCLHIIIILTFLFSQSLYPPCCRT
uniref:Uncharacterized protein n=1 Tax=Arundo donax TaxID=35708 RepID=A0A0A9J780_ARUDO